MKVLAAGKRLIKLFIASTTGESAFNAISLVAASTASLLIIPLESNQLSYISLTAFLNPSSVNSSPDSANLLRTLYLASVLANTDLEKPSSAVIELPPNLSTGSLDNASKSSKTLNIILPPSSPLAEAASDQALKDSNPCSVSLAISPRIT